MDAEDITGAAFLTHVDPSGLNNFLELLLKYPLILSMFVLKRASWAIF